MFSATLSDGYKLITLVLRADPARFQPTSITLRIVTKMYVYANFQARILVESRAEI